MKLATEFSKANGKYQELGIERVFNSYFDGKRCGY